MRYLLLLIMLVSCQEITVNREEPKPTNQITLVNEGGICTVTLRKVDLVTNENIYMEIYEFGRELTLTLDEGYYCFCLEKRDYPESDKYLIREATCGYNNEFPARILVDTVKMYD